MIIGAMSDLHFNHKIPENRTDTYEDDQLKKFERALKIVRKGADSNLLLVGGDFFESALAPYSLVYRVMNLLNRFKDITIVGVPGQHDLRYHTSGLNNTPLGTLSKAGYVTILSNKVPFEYCLKGSKEVITIIGAGWNEEPEANADILVTHRMVVYKKPLWPGQKDYSTSGNLLKKFPWAKCIVSGDNHKPHVVDTELGLQINCGSLMRSSKAQIDYNPCVWLIDTTTWKYSKKKLKITPPEEAFDFAKIEKEEKAQIAKDEANVEMDNFIASLSIQDKNRPTYAEVLKQVIQKRKPSQAVKNLINEIMEAEGCN